MIYLCYKVIKEKIVLQILVVPKCFTNFDKFDHTCFKQTQNSITQMFIIKFVFKIVYEKNDGFSNCETKRNKLFKEQFEEDN